MKPYFFVVTLQIICICLKSLLESFSLVISSQNLKIKMKIASHAWLEIAHGKNLFVFQNNKEYWNCRPSTHHKEFLWLREYFIQNKLRCHWESKIRRHFSQANMGDYYSNLNGFFCAFCYFCIKFCSARCLTATGFKRLLYLLWF